MSTTLIAPRWRVLALLFAVRMTMAIQFAMVAALSPAIEAAFAVGLTEIGLLIGLYFAPGLVIALPGGALGRRFGDREVVLAGLALMLAGGLVMALAGAWPAQLAGRFVAGIGGVLLNVLLTKMVADWFAGREISFAMAVFVNSWPVGIALALVVLPVVAAAGGLGAATGLVAILVAAGFAALALFYRAPEQAVTGAGPAPTAGGGVRGAVLAAVLVAGAIWGIYNAALATVFSFGPQLYVSRGMDLAAAGRMTSLVLWCLALTGTMAGFVADRTGRRLLILGLGNAGFAGFVALGAVTDTSLGVVLGIGLCSGIAVGAMVSLPSLVLAPSARALGMGIFFAVYYLCIAVGPMVAGLLSDAAGLPATFLLAACLLVVTVALVPVFHLLARRVAARAAVTA